MTYQCLCCYIEVVRLVVRVDRLAPVPLRRVTWTILTQRPTQQFSDTMQVQGRSGVFVLARASGYHVRREHGTKAPMLAMPIAVDTSFAGLLHPR